MPVLSVLQASIMHDVNGISINTCLQIITLPVCCIQNISSSYAFVRLNWLTKKMTIRKQFEKWMTFTLLILWSYKLSPKRTLMQHMT